MAQATLINPQGLKSVVGVGTPQASKLLSSGYKLYQAPKAAPTLTDQLNTLQGQYTNQQKDYQTQQQAYQNAQLVQGAFAKALQDALMGADSQTQGLRSQELALQQQQYTLPNQMRDQLISQGITDPFKRQALTNQRLGELNTGIRGLDQNIQQRGGNLQNVLKAGQSAYQTALQGKQFGLQNQQSNMTNTGNQIKSIQGTLQAQQAAQQKAVDDQNKFKQQIYLTQLKAALTPRKGGGGKGASGKTSLKARAYGAFQNDLNAAGENLVTTYTPQQGQGATREQIISDLTGKYGAYIPAKTIASVVYGKYPDSFR